MKTRTYPPELLEDLKEGQITPTGNWKVSRATFSKLNKWAGNESGFSDFLYEGRHIVGS